MKTCFKEETGDYEVAKEQSDSIFEWVVNKRRKYDGNTLVQLAVKFDYLPALEYLLGQ